MLAMESTFSSVDFVHAALQNQDLTLKLQMMKKIKCCLRLNQLTKMVARKDYRTQRTFRFSPRKKIKCKW
jgi:hypothetical protein